MKKKTPNCWAFLDAQPLRKALHRSIPWATRWPIAHPVGKRPPTVGRFLGQKHQPNGLYIQTIGDALTFVRRGSFESH